MADITDYDRVRVYVYEAHGNTVSYDRTRSMLLPRSDYEQNAAFFGDVLEAIPAGDEPKVWSPQG